MPLTLRPTGLASPVFADWLDNTVFEDGRAIGRIYEDKHARPDLRWFWSIIVFVGHLCGGPISHACHRTVLHHAAPAELFGCAELA
jgi:hypothetical protein